MTIGPGAERACARGMRNADLQGFMRLLLKRIHAMPRRELVRGLVVLAVALVGLVGWLDVLRALGRGDWRAGLESFVGLSIWLLFARGVMLNPAKWGFRAGLLFAGIAGVLGLVWVAILRAFFMDPERLSEILPEAGLWWWVVFAGVWTLLAVVATAGLSLRWLYKTPPTKT